MYVGSHAPRITYPPHSSNPNPNPNPISKPSTPP
jgi:hypothetical protein